MSGKDMFTEIPIVSELSSFRNLEIVGMPGCVFNFRAESCQCLNIKYKIQDRDLCFRKSILLLVANQSIVSLPTVSLKRTNRVSNFEAGQSSPFSRATRILQLAPRLRHERDADCATSRETGRDLADGACIEIIP